MVVALALAAVLAVLAGALAAVAATHDSSRHAIDRGRTAAVAAATSGVATVLSYDYRHLQGDFSRAEALLTPGRKGFRQQYVRTTAKGVEPLAAKYKAVSTAEVSAAGIVESDADRAVVLVFVSQTVTNSQLPQPRLDRSRIKVTLVRVGDSWLIDGLDPV
ncbi:MAG: Mce-associated rane protein [Frankiaceae bacterium]|nr:Mce-associated rane protein [Frankiaceae bacterium]